VAPVSRALLALSASLVALGGVCTAQAAAGQLVHVRLEGELDRGMLPQLSRAVRAAKAEPGSTLVVELDTPGGSIELMWDLSKQIREAAEQGVRTVAWVHRHADSAGVLLTISCERVYMSRDASIGSALPVSIGPAGLAPVSEDKAIREKITSAMRGDFRAMAERNGRPPALAEAMVDPDARVYQIKREGELVLISGAEWDDLRGKPDVPELVATVAGPGQILNLSATRAVELRFADGTAETLEQVAEKSGAGGTTVAVERSRSDDIVRWLDLFGPLLLIAGIVLAYAEMKVPGFGVPGILSIVCFALLVTGRYLAGLADVPHIVAIALGLLLIAGEIFLWPGTLWLGIAGFVLLVGGLVLSGLGPGFSLESGFDRQRLFAAGSSLLINGAIAVALMLVLSRYLPQTPVLRRLVLVPGAASVVGGAMPESSGRHAELARVGALGRALSPLRPVGKVALDADPNVEFEARSSGALIDAGERVRVVEFSAARLVVEPAGGVPA
jgi:membrane-bound serine protease (ClpP class)